MGCAPSRPNTSIRVEQRQNAEQELLDEDWKLPDIASLMNETASQKDIFEIPDDEDGDLQKSLSSNNFLQESMISQFSQLSTNSSSSWDSGVYELDEEYSYIITENSAPEKVQLVDSEFIPKDNLELVLEGKACPRKLSSKDRDRMEQQAILETLRQEGLVVRPPARAVGGLSFEVVSAQDFPTDGLPFLRRLPPLEIEKKKKKVLTYEEIQKKLAEAEERRKKRNEEKLRKLAMKDVHELQAIAEQQMEKSREKYERKLQEKAKSREQHLNEVQERLKARAEHAERVRKRKEMLASGFNYVIPNQTE